MRVTTAQRSVCSGPEATSSGRGHGERRRMSKTIVYLTPPYEGLKRLERGFTAEDAEKAAFS
jgi:hypothetical protein